MHAPPPLKVLLNLKLNPIGALNWCLNANGHEIIQHWLMKINIFMSRSNSDLIFAANTLCIFMPLTLHILWNMLASQQLLPCPIFYPRIWNETNISSVHSDPTCHLCFFFSNFCFGCAAAQVQAESTWASIMTQFCNRQYPKYSFCGCHAFHFGIYAGMLKWNCWETMQSITPKPKVVRKALKLQ